MPINTEVASARYRSLLIDTSRRRILLTNYHGTEQERDLTEPPNCGGVGRIRHFCRHASAGWVSNPLPIDPAARALGLGTIDELSAQVFQNAGCNWRCWYCFVPFELLSANPKHSEWVTVSQMVDLLLQEHHRPSVIDLSGGEPELTPEWIVWVLEELRRRSLDRDFYVWSDDNLSTDYFWKYLSSSEQELVATFPNYGRVGCFKGFDRESFTYNTNAEQAAFDRQFELMRRLVRTGMDVYAYVTFTTPGTSDLRTHLSDFVDRLQQIDANLPLRTIPLEVRVFSPVGARLTDIHRQALQNQWLALDAWQYELDRRFASGLRAEPIADVPLATWR